MRRQHVWLFSRQNDVDTLFAYYNKYILTTYYYLFHTLFIIIVTLQKERLYVFNWPERSIKLFFKARIYMLNSLVFKRKISKTKLQTNILNDIIMHWKGQTS